jgi:hypothetical protein
MKPVIIHNSSSPVTISMKDMEVFSFAIVVDDRVGAYTDRLVWRISEDSILDMSSELVVDNGWTKHSTLKVRPVEVKMTLEVL